MASFDKLDVLSTPVLNVALDPANEDDLYIIKVIADTLSEQIDMTDSYYVLKKLSQNLTLVCDVILEAGSKKSPDCGHSQEPF